jgi:predicted O-linked N-acetylglucosamine transferase (SPINDLY family)
VPVITLLGRSHAGRVGASLLRAAGIEDWCVASSPDDYVRKACALAGDRSQRREWRRNLRSSLIATPLLNSTRFAREFEQGLRECWRNYCSRLTEASAKAGSAST